LKLRKLEESVGRWTPKYAVEESKITEKVRQMARKEWLHVVVKVALDRCKFTKSHTRNLILRAFDQAVDVTPEGGSIADSRLVRRIAEIAHSQNKSGLLLIKT